METLSHYVRGHNIPLYHSNKTGYLSTTVQYLSTTVQYLPVSCVYVSTYNIHALLCVYMQLTNTKVKELEVEERRKNDLLINQYLSGHD